MPGEGGLDGVDAQEGFVDASVWRTGDDPLILAVRDWGNQDNAGQADE